MKRTASRETTKLHLPESFATVSLCVFHFVIIREISFLTVYSIMSFVCECRLEVIIVIDYQNLL